MQFSLTAYISVAALSVQCVVGWQTSPDIAQVLILTPQKLAEEKIQGPKSDGGQIKGDLTSFSPPPMDQRVIGRVVYNASHSFHCSADYLNNLPLPTSIKSPHRVDTPIIVIVDELGGECSLPQKVLVAADRYSAVGVIVASDATKTNENSATENDSDGWQATIPSIIIENASAHILKAALTAVPPPEKESRYPSPGEDIITVELKWQLPQRAIVALDIWADPIEPGMTQFNSDVAFEATEFSDRLAIRLHFPVFESPTGGVNCADDKPYYCAEDPDASGALTGEDIVIEAMQQLCILDGAMEGRQSGVRRSQADFLTYITAVQSQCDPLSVEAHTYRNCASKVATSVLAPSAHASYESCMSKTRGKALLAQQVASTVHRRGPAIAINGVAFNGLTERMVLRKTLCMAFTDQPLSCVAHDGTPIEDPMIAVPENVAAEKAMILEAEQEKVAEGFSIFFLTLALALSLVMLCGCFLIHPFRARDKLSATIAGDVKTVLSEYHPILP